MLDTDNLSNCKIQLFNDYFIYEEKGATCTYLALCEKVINLLLVKR